MTDDLTPEEKRAFDNLPRERMPVGLEARVVEAMRERGFLEKRRRTIVLTSGHVAGLVAASVALVIGAYSIGLHRGGGEAVVPPVVTLTEGEGDLLDRAAVTPKEEAAEQMAADEAAAPSAPPARSEEAPVDRTQQVRLEEKNQGIASGGARDDETSDVAEAGKKNIPESREEIVEPATVPPAPADEGLAKQAQKAGAEEPAFAQERRQSSAPPTEETATLRSAAKDAGRARAMTFDTARPAPKQSFTFLLNGTPLTVEADSVRVTEDRRGRILHIYTQEGIIRLRLASD